MPTFAQVKAGYRNLWNKAVIRPERRAAAEKLARRMLANREPYEAVEKATNVPWFFIGLAHMRESDMDFRGVLHNGQHIIGTGRKTSIEPIGRGPFTTWKGAAVDALTLKHLHQVTDWCLERMLFLLEGFNGYGYYSKGINAPYVWSWTNLYSKGKYTRDHHFDPEHVDQQPGVAAVLKALIAIDQGVAARVGSGSSVEPLPAPKPAPAPAPKPAPAPAPQPAPARPGFLEALRRLFLGDKVK